MMIKIFFFARRKYGKKIIKEEIVEVDCAINEISLTSLKKMTKNSNIKRYELVEL